MNRLNLGIGTRAGRARALAHAAQIGLAVAALIGAGAIRTSARTASDAPALQQTPPAPPQAPPGGATAQGGPPRAVGGRGWTIPAGAAQEANPIAASPEVLEKGKKVYGSKCQRCHGPAGKGDGPDADPDAPPDDLTDSARAARNPDGVMFYKIWNGRKSPKMPAFADELSKDDVWTVVHYAKSLRK